MDFKAFVGRVLKAYADQVGDAQKKDLAPGEPRFAVPASWLSEMRTRLRRWKDDNKSFPAPNMRDIMDGAVDGQLSLKVSLAKVILLTPELWTRVNALFPRLIPVPMEISVYIGADADEAIEVLSFSTIGDLPFEKNGTIVVYPKGNEAKKRVLCPAIYSRDWSVHGLIQSGDVIEVYDYD